MAMINCPDCGTEVSKNAEACPKCGRKHPKLNKMNLFAKEHPILSIILSFLFVYLILGPLFLRPIATNILENILYSLF